MADFVETIAFEVEDKGAVAALKQLDDALAMVDDGFDDAAWSAEQAAAATSRLEKEAAKTAKALDRQLAKEAREAAKETAKLERDAKKTADAFDKRLTKEIREAARAADKLERETKRAADALEKDLSKAAQKASKEMDDLSRQKVMGAKKGLESLGISGEATANVFTLIGFAVGLAGAKLLEFTGEGLRVAIADSITASAAADELSNSYRNFQSATVDAVIGLADTTAGMDKWSKALEGATLIMKESAKEQDTFTGNWRIMQGPLALAEEGIDGVANALAGVAENMPDEPLVRGADGFMRMATTADITQPKILAMSSAMRQLRIETEAMLDAQKGFTRSERGQGQTTDTVTALSPTGKPLSAADRKRLNKSFGRDEFGRPLPPKKRGRGGGAKKTEAARSAFDQDISDLLGLSALAPSEEESGLAGIGGIGKGDFGPGAAEIQQTEEFSEAINKMNDELAKAGDLGDDLNRAFADAAAETNLLQSSLVDLAVGGFFVATDAGFGMIEMMATGKFQMRDYVEFGLAQFGEFAQSLGKMWFFQGLASGNPAQAIAGLALAGVGAAMSGGANRRGGPGPASSTGDTGAADRAQNRAAFRRQSETDDRAVDQHFTLILDRDQVEAVAIRTNERAVRRRKIPSSRRGR